MVHTLINTRFVLFSVSSVIAVSKQKKCFGENNYIGKKFFGFPYKSGGNIKSKVYLHRNKLVYVVCLINFSFSEIRKVQF